MARIISYMLVLGLLTASSTAIEAIESEGQARALVIHLEEGLLTVHATGMPHRHILERLAKRLQFELIVNGPLEDRRSVAIERRPWEEGLKRVLSPASWAFVYKTSAGASTLAQVFVFPPDGGPILVRSPAHASRAASPAPTLSPEPDQRADQTSHRAEIGIEASLADLPDMEDAEMRALTLVGLAVTGREQAIQELQHALQDEQEYVRIVVQEALSRLQPPPQ